LLIEGNTSKTSRFSSYDDVGDDNDSWNPDHHTIDDEHAFYRFLGRAILSSPTLKILQTKDEQGSYRSVGAIGLISSLLEWKKTAPLKVPSANAAINTLYHKLKSRGIPWQISRRLSEEIGSVEQLEKIYGCCERSARPWALVPIIKNSCLSMIETEKSRTLLEYGTVDNWSAAIHSAWYSKLNDPSQAIALFEENKFFANDRAHFLATLHLGKSTNRAIQESNIADEKSAAEYPVSRRVRIESIPKYSKIFPSDIATETFYESVSVEENPLGMCLPAIMMETIYGDFQSNKLVLCILEGSELLQRIECELRSKPMLDSIDVANLLAKQIHSECSSFLLRLPHDRRVLVVRGLPAALDAAAKQSGYRPECKILSDLILAELMLRHNIVVIHAFRVTNDLEMIAREFAMACFYYQLTCRRVR
jgi:hypothetical protein